MKKILILLITLGIAVNFQNTTTATNAINVEKIAMGIDTVLISLNKYGTEVGLAKRIVFEDGDEFIDPPYCKGKLQKCCSFRKETWFFTHLDEEIVKPYLITSSLIVVKRDIGEPQFYRIKRGS